MAARARLHEIVAANAPVLYLHREERFMPCSVELFLQHSELWRMGPDGRPQDRLRARGEVTPGSLMASQRGNRGGANLLLVLDPAVKHGAPQDQIDDVPLYVNAKEVVAADGSVEALELNYITCWGHNGPLAVGGCFQAGAHDGDWEHFTVRVDAGSGATLGAYFHAHRNQDGVWRTAAAMPRCRDGTGRPAAYVALSAHGKYPTPGVQLRAGLAANDRTGDGGPVWRPRRCILLPYIAGTYTPPANAGVQQPAPGRRLMQVPSRGSTLVAGVAPAAVAGAAVPAAAVPVQPASASNISGSGGGSGYQAAATPGAAAPIAAPVAGAAGAGGGGVSGGHPGAHVQVVEDPAAWLAFEGRWGARETPSPITQKWFRAAEPPVGRTLLRRILHFPAEQKLGEQGCRP